LRLQLLRGNGMDARIKSGHDGESFSSMPKFLAGLRREA
jgi:hypothetical protein